MILQNVCILFVMVLSAETLPFSKIDHRPASMNQVDQNFYGPDSAFYLLSRLPVRRSSRKFFGHPRPPTLQFSDMLNRVEKKIDGFRPSRSTPLSSIFFDQYLRNIDQQTANKVQQFGQRVKDTVENYEKLHGERMQKMKETFERTIRLEDVKKRLKQAFLTKKSLMNKLHGMGWRGKYVGVPYHTMNDDHMIVKKPGANFDLHSQSNIEIPNLVPVPFVQPIVTQHPVLPEVTTSVNLHQGWEVPATIDGYIFPITSIANHTPEETDTSEITNSITKLTTPQLPSDATGSTTISTDPATESIILEKYTTRIPFDEEIESTTEVETIFISANVSSVIENENYGNEIGSTSFSFYSTDAISQTERNEPFTSQANLLIDLLSGIQVKPITSLVMDMESTTNEIGTTFPSTITIVDDKVTSSIIYAETFYFTLPNVTTTLGIQETSELPLTLETTTVSGEPSTSMDAAFTSPEIDPELTSEAVFTISPIISTGRPMVTDAMFTNTDEAFGSLTIDEETTTEIVSTLPSTISTETTSWLPPTLGITSLGLEDNRSPSSTYEVETITEADSTFVSAIPTDTTTTTIDRSTTVDPIFYDSTNEVERNTEIFPTFPSTTLEEIYTTTLFDSLSIDERTTTEIVPTFSSTVSAEPTSTLIFEATTSSDVLSRFGNYHSTGTEVTEVDLTFPSTISTEATTTVTERSTSDDRTSVAETFSTFLSTVSFEPTTIHANTFTTTNSPFDSPTIDEDLIEDVISTFFSTVPTEANETPIFEIDTLLDALPRFWYNHSTGSTIAPETITEVDSTLLSTIPTETTTMMIEKLSTMDLAFDSSTIDMEITTENDSALPSTVSIKTPSNLEEISSTIDPALNNSTHSDVDTTSEIISTSSSTISLETISWPLLDFEVTPVAGVLYRIGYDRFQSSTYEVETTTTIDSIFSSAITTEKTTTMTESSTIATFESLAIDMDMTTEIGSTFSSIISTEATTNSEEIYESTSSPFDTSTTDEGRATQDLPTFFFLVPTETTTDIEEISEAIYPAFNSFTDDGETTTRIASTSPTEISTETNAVTTNTYDAVTEENFEYLEGNLADDVKGIGRMFYTKLDSLPPGFADNIEEEPDEKSLLNLIPLTIEELRQGNVTLEEEETLSQIFGELWPLLKEESKRKEGELMNHKLAIFLFEAGQEISDTEQHVKDNSASDVHERTS